MKSMKRPDDFTARAIAYIHTDFPAKFGIPRQSGLCGSLEGEIVFEPEFRREEAVRGLDEYSHLWLIWKFSECERAEWSPTVRPPRLGGNTRVGVFATRSPFRPNPIGLSSVRLLEIDRSRTDSPVLRVSGCDLMDGTPILDIKPYLAFTDSHSDASGGFSDAVKGYALKVNFPPELLAAVDEPKRAALLEALAEDPRPSYQNDPDRVYGFFYAGKEIKFNVKGEALTVVAVI